MTRFAIAIASITVLAGCAATGPTDAQRELLRIQSQAKEAGAQAQACLKPIESNPKYAIIYRHVGVTAALPSAAQLADRGVPDDAAMAIAFDWFAEAERCNVNSATALANIDPELGRFGARVLLENTQILDDVFRASPRPTYGEINQRLYEKKARQQAEIRVWATNLRARLEAQHAQEISARQQELETQTTVLNLVVDTLQMVAAHQSSIARAQRKFQLAFSSYDPGTLVSISSCKLVRKIVVCTQIDLNQNPTGSDSN